MAHRLTPSSRCLQLPRLLLASGMALFCTALNAQAAIIAVENASFESPKLSDYGSPIALPYDHVPMLPWQITQTALYQHGVFPNQPSNAEDYIDNVDGTQVAFMFAGPGISIYQDLTAPEAIFELGKAYRFTIAAGGNGGLPDDARLELRLYYRDGDDNRVTVASSSFLFDPDLDPGYINHLFDYSVESPLVQASDPWLGKAIGIEIATPATDPNPGSYWDLDNVRVESVPEPATGAILAIGALLLGGRNRRRA